MKEFYFCSFEKNSDEFEFYYDKKSKAIQAFEETFGGAKKPTDVYLHKIRLDEEESAISVHIESISPVDFLLQLFGCDGNEMLINRPESNVWESRVWAEKIIRDKLYDSDLDVIRDFQWLQEACEECQNHPDECECSEESEEEEEE